MEAMRCVAMKKQFPIISFEHASFQYEGQSQESLKDVKLIIKSGEFLVITGQSGCGKTTMLNLMAGFETPTRGEVLYRGNPIKKPSWERGVVFQEYSLLPWMSVIENVEYGLDGKKLSDKEKNQIAMDCLTMVGLSEFIDHRPNLLSGGMKQRVAIARTLAMDPDIMLMDEPFSSLDEQTRRRLDGEVCDIWLKKQKTIVFVTHSVDEALLLGTRIIMFSQSPGEIVKEWSISVDHSKRDLTANEFVSLKQEILSTLQACSCADNYTNNPKMIKIEGE